MKLQISMSRGSDVLYHLTNVSAAASICSKNRFELIADELESIGTDQLHRFFLSCARSPQSSYFQKIGTFSVIFKLNGRKLATRYLVRPVDYWGTNETSDDKQGDALRRAQRYEMEDRVFSKAPYINDALSYVDEIHAMKNDKTDALFTLKKFALLNKIPIFLYDSDNDLRLLNKKRSSMIALMPARPKNVLSPEYAKNQFIRKFRKGALAGWIELYKTPIIGTPYATAKQTPHRMLAYQILQYDDAINSFNADMHNSKSVKYDDVTHDRERLDELIHIMRKAKQTPDQFIKALRAKWYPR